MLEKDVQKVVIDYLKIKKIFYWRNNTGALVDKANNNFVRFGQTGSPDIFVVKDGRIYGLEIKNEKGRQSDNQKSWERDFTSNGGLYFIIRDIEDVIKLF